MKILVVDDNHSKRSHIVQILQDGLSGRIALNIDVASDYEEALEALRRSFFDLVVLDLLLPAAGAAPSSDTSRALVHAILAGRLVAPTFVIGLTAYRNLESLERRYYEEHLFALDFYDPIDLSWSERVLNRIRYLNLSKSASVQSQINNYDMDVFILVARHENEYVPIRRSLFKNIEELPHPVWSGDLTLGTIRHRKRDLRCGLACVGEMGMAPTAALTAQAISIFRPRLVAMLGMCCGFSVPECSSPRKLMDAIVVRDVACWEEGKYVEQTKSKSEFRNRAKTRLVDDAIRDTVENTIERGAGVITPALKRYAAKSAFKKVRTHFGENHVRELPDVRFGTLVTGSSVIANEKVVREIIERHPTAIGLDMEIYGLYTAAERCIGRRPSVLGIKGVADYGHAEKDDHAQREASVVATEVFKAIIQHLDIF